MLRIPHTPKQVKYTTWRNPLDHDVHLDITGDGNFIGFVERYPVPAGGTCEIPSCYDWAVQNTHGGNPAKGEPPIILGGLGPQLINESLPKNKRPILHDALDTEKAKLRQMEAEAAATAVMRKQAEEAAMLMATGVAKALKAEKKDK